MVDKKNDYGLVMKVYGEIRYSNPNATLIDAEMAVERIREGSRGVGLDLVLQYGINPEVADCMVSEAKRR